MKGQVKNFDRQKGFGFIRAEDGKDVFFHYSEIKDEEGVKIFYPGDMVEFKVEDLGRGPTAREVRKIH